MRTYWIIGMNPLMNVLELQDKLSGNIIYFKCKVPVSKFRIRDTYTFNKGVL